MKELQKLFKVLADANRLRIIEVLSKECESVNQIANKAGISQPLTSHHLKILKEAGIARVENQATFNYYCIKDERVWQLIQKCKEIINN